MPDSTQSPQAVDATETRRPAKTILLVDDEEAVRALVGLILRRQGFEVIEACGAEEALALGPGTGRAVDLLLTDLVMPGTLTGLELAGQLMARWPSLQVIVTSGYTKESLEGNFFSDPRTRFLSKPYNPATLVDLIKQTIGPA